MKSFTKAVFEKHIHEGRFEAETDINRFGRVDIRWTRSGKRETVTVN